MRVLVVLALLAPCLAAASPDWIARSNANAAPLLDDTGLFNPEAASRTGNDKFDTAVVDLGPRIEERIVARFTQRLEEARAKREVEKDVRVREDLDIIIANLERQLEAERTTHEVLFTYYDASAIVNSGLMPLLDARNKPERQARALVRIRRYAGLEPGYTPVATLARRRTEEELARPGTIGPYVDEVTQDLDNTDFFIKGIAERLHQDGLTGWEKDYEVLAGQLRDYREWARRTVLPRARADVKLPPRIYALQLRQVGVDASPEEILDRASTDFQEVRSELVRVAAQVAKARGFASSDYRDVIRQLKKVQLPADSMVDFYRKRLRDEEAIIRREHLVTLPQRAAAIRLATEAESAQVPAPHLSPPRILGNTGEFGEFIIPVSNPHSKSGAPMDDFSFDAATWTITAHEARPGHELQFASMVEQGVSIPRALFAYNSANVEGWGLYAESIMEPYFPPEGRLISLQYRLLRIARAMLDPMINLGRITPAQAKDVLMNDVVLSEPFAQEEVDRYAFWAPGQATSYYYGFSKLRALRTRVELALGPRFDAGRFHDFVIAQGLLPPPVLERAVMEQFVPAELRK